MQDALHELPDERKTRNTVAASALLALVNAVLVDLANQVLEGQPLNAALEHATAGCVDLTK